MSQTVILRRLSTNFYNLKTNRSISHGSEYCLCIGVKAYFYGWCNTNPDFGIWSAYIDGTTQKFVSGTFRSVNSKTAYILAKYFISVNNWHRFWDFPSLYRVLASHGRRRNESNIGGFNGCSYEPVCFWYILDVPLAKKRADFQVWKVANHWNATTKSGFLLPENSTRHTATSSGVNIENRDSETYFKLFNHLLLREDCEVPQNPHWLEN